MFKRVVMQRGAEKHENLVTIQKNIEDAAEKIVHTTQRERKCPDEDAAAGRPERSSRKEIETNGKNHLTEASQASTGGEF